ncbi:islet cell autoantigen 1-like protein [Glossina fuscipes fuscipes]|uniref:AH domain-containing protein n=1 Tax=Glossina palpalis gambiensis TaxID=67801 RepID=A0A1B0BHU2_9MUSC
MQHQFWITKKTVQRKLGSKEDNHIISSDAELDAKIEIFRSIDETSVQLGKIIDLYQERVCVLSQEESVFGRFLKEAGKRSKTTGQFITNTGKAVSYSGQQRMCVRVPLLRLQNEVNVFRARAISDMQSTLTSMEKERTVYRAALEWMKSASSELDPDTGRGLDKFRTAQSHVRIAKQNFDKLTLDSIQKIDLLAAARCNMFSHVLISYMMELKQFAQKTANTFDALAQSLQLNPKYDFCILKDLTHKQSQQQENNQNQKPLTLDKDQSLFFADNYTDEDNSEISKGGSNSKESLRHRPDSESLIEMNENNQYEALNITNETEKNSLMPPTCRSESESSCFLLPNHPDTQTPNIGSQQLTPQLAVPLNNARNEAKKKIKSNNPWIELFADLDPLLNLDAFDLKLSGNQENFQQT